MIAILLLALALPAQDAPRAKGETMRIINTQVFGDDPCPEGTDDEIIVCARLPEGERFRVPQALREPSGDPAAQAWTNRVETMDEAGRLGGGLPNTCSAVGSGGQTGCNQQLLRQWFDERRTSNPPPTR